MLTSKQYVRYERHVELCGVDNLGQQKLLNANVLIIGAGGLGCPVSTYLAGAGVGQLTIIDDDVINISNLHRQFSYNTSQVGKIKVTALKERLEQQNPDCKVTALTQRLDATNASDLVQSYDLVVDGSDNFDTRYLLNAVCHQHSKTLVSGSILQFDGQVYVFKTHQNGPCYRCLYPTQPTNFQVPSCTESAVLGPVAGVIGTLMAVEILKELLGLEESLNGSLLLYSALNTEIRKVSFLKKPDCPTCGPSHQAGI